MDVRIEKLVYGGEGLAHHEDQTVFVPLVLPGELVNAEPVTRKKKFVRARLQQVLEPAPERIAAPCPYFGRCGGCQYQHISYEAQLRFKADILRETLSRLGRVRWEGLIETHASPAFGYRNRAQWKLRAPQDAGAGAAGIGYFEAGSSRLCAVDECAILSPRLAETFQNLRKLSGSNKRFSAVDEIEAFCDAAGEKVLLNLSGERLGDAAEPIVAALRGAVPNVESIVVQERRTQEYKLDGPGYLTYSAGGFGYRVGHLSFFQVNQFLVDALIDAVIGDNTGRLALDLFAGVGLFTIPLAKRFARVIGVESNLAAVRDLEANLQSSTGASLAHRHMTVEGFLSHWHEKPDLVVLDPPRAGVEPATLTHLKKLAPGRINYLSCDPATLARDLATLVGDADNPGPYEISNIYLFDIFPQTYHMEALVRLNRRT